MNLGSSFVNVMNTSPSNHGSNGHFTSNLGNKSFNRNGSISNPSSIEKVISKYQQLAKDAQSSGDPVLIENYLQHAEHYSRKLAEINFKNQSATNSSSKNDSVNTNQDSSEDKKV